MITWEYLIEDAKWDCGVGQTGEFSYIVPITIEELNEFGKDGWEIIDMTKDSDNYMIQFIAKRIVNTSLADYDKKLNDDYLSATSYQKG